MTNTTHHQTHATHQPTHAPVSTKNELAIASFITGVASLAMMVPFVGIAAIVLGIIALKKKQADRGLSIAGIVTGAVGTLIFLAIAAFVVLGILIGIYGESANFDNSLDYYKESSQLKL